MTHLIKQFSRLGVIGIQSQAIQRRLKVTEEGGQGLVQLVQPLHRFGRWFRLGLVGLEDHFLSEEFVHI